MLDKDVKFYSEMIEHAKKERRCEIITTAIMGSCCLAGWCYFIYMAFEVLTR